MAGTKVRRNAKVVATLGPASREVSVISELILAGMNVARVNMSHGTHEEHGQLIANIRAASQKVGLEVAVLLDLQGPKIRVGHLHENLLLREGEVWAIGQSGDKGDYPEYADRFIPTVYDNLMADLTEGARVLFNDGQIVAQALEQDGDIYKMRILTGGQLGSGKGINLPDSKVSAPNLTEKDRKDCLFGLANDVDYVALSFVRNRDGVLDLRKLMEENDRIVPIVSKIENREAVEDLEDILEVTDLIMVARGDMGVELGNHLVPAIQKRIISLCNQKGVPVITATQMLESMVDHPFPTRAEATDVANAIWDGTDAVMLSGETAVGRYPVQTVAMMTRIVVEAERTPKPRPSLKTFDLTQVDDAIMVGASLIAEKVQAKRILSVTESGSSCLKMSRFRPRIPVVGISNSLSVVRRMCLYWGVSPFYLMEYDEDDSELEYHVIEKVKSACELGSGDKIVITRGTGAFFARGTSNSIRVVTIS